MSRNPNAQNSSSVVLEIPSAQIPKTTPADSMNGLALFERKFHALRERLQTALNQNQGSLSALANNVVNLGQCNASADELLSHFGTLVLEFSDIAKTVYLRHMLGQQATTTTPKKKRKNASKGSKRSQARRHAKNSTPSTPKRAKRARTGGRSKVRLASEDDILSRSLVRNKTSSAIRSKRKRK